MFLENHDTFVPLYLYLEDDYETPRLKHEEEDEESTSRGVVIIEIFNET